MIKVYTAEHPTEAYMVKGILEADGIECTVLGDILFAARGEVPLTPETAPSVWITDERRYARAREIVRGYEEANRRKRQASASWRCSTCGEHHEEQFSHCWRCGHPRGYPAAEDPA